MMKSKKRGVFFTIDALIGLVILLVGVLIIFPTIMYSQDKTEIKEDVINVLSTLKVGEINDPFVQQLVSENKITNLDRNILEQIGEFYITNETLAENLSQVVLKYLHTNNHIGIWVVYDNGNQEKKLASKDDSSYLNSSNVQVLSEVVTGVGNTSDSRFNSSYAYSSRAYLLKNMQTKYYYFGGYDGEGNITMRIDYNGTINSSEMEITVSDDFSVYVNGNNIGSYGKSPSDYVPQKYSIPTDQFHSGTNYLMIAGNNLHLSGGYIKISYESNKSYEDTTRFYFPGIKGAINVYDGFYIPDNLSNMSIWLNYSSDTYNNIILTIGNTTILRENSSGNYKQVYISDENLKSNLSNYAGLSGENVPIRLGLENASGQLRPQADIVFMIDTTNSMQNEINNVSSIAKNFSDALAKSSVDWRLGLIEFRDYNVYPCGLNSYDYPMGYKKHFFGDAFQVGLNKAWDDGVFENSSVGTQGSNHYIEYQLDTSKNHTLDPATAALQMIQTSPSGTNNYTILNGTLIVAQGFRPLLPGYVQNITLNISKVGSPPELEAAIYFGNSANCDGLNLDNISLNSDNFSNNFNLVNFSFSSKAYVNTSYGFYYVHLKIKGDGSGSDENNYYKLGGTVGYNINLGQSWFDPYGNAPMCYCNGSKWGSIIKTYDYYFKVFLNSPSLPPSGYVEYNFSEPDSVKWRVESGNSYADGILGSHTSAFTFEMKVSDDKITWSQPYYGVYRNDSYFYIMPPGKYLKLKINLPNVTDGNCQMGTIRVLGNASEFTSNVSSFKSTVSSMFAQGGGDLPEAHLEAINVSISNYSWRTNNNTKKFDIMLSDAPPHSSDCWYFDGTKYGLTNYSCVKGTTNTSAMINNLLNKKITFYYLNEEDNGICDMTNPEGYTDLISRNMTNMTGGKYYPFDQSEGVDDLILSIAGDIVNVSYQGQSIVTAESLNTFLSPDSYIEFNYTKKNYPYGFIVDIEKKFVDNDTGSFIIPTDSNLLDAKVVSYSGPRWTDSIFVNGNLSYNLSEFGSNYVQLGDPYELDLGNFTPQYNNTVNITTAFVPGNSLEGSSDNKILYKLIKNYVTYSVITPFSYGCNWTIEFEDGTSYNLTIPENYDGFNHDKVHYDKCHYSESDHGYDNSEYPLDSMKDGAYNLFKSLDFDGNGKLDVKFTDQNLGVNTSVMAGIPWHYSVDFQIREWY